MRKVYFCRSEEDKPLAEQIVQDLQDAGVEVWMYSGILEREDIFPKSLDLALTCCRTMLLLWSAAAESSSWVEREWTSAIIFNKKVVVCRLDDTPLPPALMSEHQIDFRGVHAGLQELIRKLQQIQPDAIHANLPEPVVEAIAAASKSPQLVRQVPEGHSLAVLNQDNRVYYNLGVEIDTLYGRCGV